MPKNKNINPAEALRRKYEKKARKMIGMVTYGKEFENNKQKAQTVLNLIFDYIAYVRGTRDKCAYPMKLNAYIEKRKNYEINEPDEDSVISVMSCMKERGLAVIDKVWNNYIGDKDESNNYDNDDYDESCEGCNDCGECASFEKCNKMNADPKPFATASLLNTKTKPDIGCRPNSNSAQCENCEGRDDCSDCPSFGKCHNDVID